jgi:hypothetical protein
MPEERGGYKGESAGTSRPRGGEGNARSPGFKLTVLACFDRSSQWDIARSELVYGERA